MRRKPPPPTLPYPTLPYPTVPVRGLEDTPPPSEQQATKLARSITDGLAKLEQKNPGRVATPKYTLGLVSQIERELAQSAALADDLPEALARLEADGLPRWWTGKIGVKALLKHAGEFASGEWTGGAAAPPPPPRPLSTREKIAKQKAEIAERAAAREAAKQAQEAGAASIVVIDGGAARG